MGLRGLFFNKSYIRWKILFGLGTGFWLLLCLYDVFWVDPVTKSFYSNSDEYNWLSQVADEELLPEVLPHTRHDEIHFPEDKMSFGIYLMLCNIITFVITFVLCVLGRAALARWWKYKNYYNNLNLSSADVDFVTKKNSSSKIPILLPTKCAATTTQEAMLETREKETQIERNPSFIKMEKDNHNEESNFLRNSLNHIDLTLKPSKEQNMEKQCAKLRDEMILIQASSLKEHAALSRKLELVTKEKRDLTKQLMIAQKENRVAKQQLEELLAEKTLLIKRLENATKEFKTNTKSKKHLLAKLEEAQATIANLKQDLEKSAKERELLRSKLQVLDVEYRFMKDRLNKHEQTSDKAQNTIEIIESKDIVDEVVKETKVVEAMDFTQSQKDVQKVQLRLINLEKSLDKLKFCKWSKNSNENSTSQLESNTESDLGRSDQEPSGVSMQSDSEVEYQTSPTFVINSNISTEVKEVQKNLLGQCDNLTDEQRRKILTPESFSGDEYEQSKHFRNLKEEFDHELSFEGAENILNFLKSSPNPIGQEFNFHNIADEIPVNEGTTTANEDESTDEWEPPKTRFVSNSAAFKNFLKSMGNLDKNQRKFTLSSNIF